MGYGFGAFLLVVGLVLALAVTDQVNGVDLTMVGWIMTIVGALLIVLTAATVGRRGTRPQIMARAHVALGSVGAPRDRDLGLALAAAL